MCVVAEDAGTFLVLVEACEAMMEKLDDIELAKLVKKREHEPTVKVAPKTYSRKWVVKTVVRGA